MTKVERTCPRCHLVFVSDKLDGLCPSCLLNSTLNLGEAETGERAFWEEEVPHNALGRVFSHFEIIEEIGRGGMGTVYKARDLASDRLIALKILQAHHLDEPDLVRRFRSEVRAVTSLDHRNILPVHEVGECDGIPFFSMKLATGGSLAAHLGDYLGRPREAAFLVAKIARGVQHAHEHGILHRDLKPGNILLDDEGEPYVCDFGLAKWIDDDQRLTITSAVLGTPHYIAPEQASGERGLTIAADIYSLGAILYELLTGRPPFVGESVIDTLRQASEGTVAKPSSIVNHTPKDLETVCLKALERQPSARYKTAAAFADDIENWLSGRPIRARPVSAAEQLWRWARRNPLPACLLTILGLAVTTIAIGATISAIKIDRARTRAVAAEKDAREQLYASLLAQARASRMTDQAGHRIDALAAIKKAAMIRQSLELRNEAIAALTLVDLQIARSVKIRDNAEQRVSYDSALKTAAVSTHDNGIALVSLTDGSIQKVIAGKKKPILALVHGGARFVAARFADNSVSVFALDTGAEVFSAGNRPFPHRLGFLASDCVFSDDETLLALGSSSGLDVIELATGKTIAHVNSPQPGHLAFDHAGRRIVFGNIQERSLRVWHFRDNEEAKVIALPAEAGFVAWSGDSTRVAVCCSDFSIQVFDTTTWANVGSLVGHRQEITRATFNHAGDMIASSSRDRTTRLWDMRTFSELVALPKYGGEPPLAFSQDDKTLAVTNNKIDTILFSVVGADRICTAFAPLFSSEGVYSDSTLDFSPDSRLLASASTRAVLIFDPKTSRLLATIPNAVPTQTTLRFLKDGRTLAVLPRRSGLSLYTCRFADGRLELVSTDNTGEFANYNFGSAQSGFDPYVCLLSQDRQVIVNASTPLWEEVASLPEQPHPWDMVLSPDHKWAVTAYKDKYYSEVWSFGSGKLEKKTEIAGGHGGILGFSASGRWLAVSGTGANHLLWDTANWSPGVPLPPQVEDETTFFAFSRDDSLLAATLLEQVVLVSLPSGKLLGELDQHLQPNAVPRLRFSPDGSTLAAQGIDNSLCLWNLTLLEQNLKELGLSW